MTWEEFIERCPFEIWSRTNKGFLVRTKSFSIQFYKDKDVLLTERVSGETILISNRTYEQMLAIMEALQ